MLINLLSTSRDIDMFRNLEKKRLCPAKKSRLRVIFRWNFFNWKLLNKHNLNIIIQVDSFFKNKKNIFL